VINEEEGKKLATRWMEEIKAGLDYRKKYSTRSLWDSYRQYYRGQWAEGITPVNKIFSYGRMLIPKVYFRAPRVTVTASKPDMVWHAKVVEALDNLLIKEVCLKYTLKMSSLDSYLCGVGPIKLGYDSEFGYLPEQAIDAGGETVTQFSTKEDNERIEYSSSVKPGTPWAVRVRPEDVIVPWGSSDMHSLPWIGHYILRPLDDIKSDQKYKNTKDLQGTRSPSIENEVRAKESYRPRSEQNKGIVYGELWEVRDVKTRQIMTFCENQLILSANDVLQTDEGMPWEFIAFNQDPEFFWAIPDAHIIAPQQLELNLSATQEARHRSIALLKFLYLEGKVTKEELEKFLSGEVGVAVGIKSDSDNIGAVVVPLQPHIPPDFGASQARQIQAMREELGFSQNQEGAFSPYHGKTASESMIVAEAFEQRVDERRDIVADVLVNIVRKWNKMLFNFWSSEKVIQIVSPEGEPFWITYTGDQLKGDYTLSVDADSGVPLSRALRYQMGKELMQMFGGDQLIDQMQLRKIVLDNYDVVDPRVPQLLQPGFAGMPQIESALRQPGPGASGPGKGSAGGRQGSTPEKPMEFEQMKKQFEQRR